MAMAASAQLARLHISFSASLSSPKPNSILPPSLPFTRLLSSSLSPLSHCQKRRKASSFAKHRIRASIKKLCEAETIPIPKSPEELDGRLPACAGVYGVYDSTGELQFVGISRNIAASVSKHRSSVPDLCSSVKVGPTDEATPDRATLAAAWKSWMEEHMSLANGKPPPGNVAGNYTWVGSPPDLRLTPGRHVSLTVPLEELIDRLVKENKIVAFIKGSRRAPQCGFSQRVIAILESHSTDFVTVDVLDEEHNYGLRESLKSYSNWPTFPQVFVRGELLGGCDIVSSLAENGELAEILKK